VQQSITFRNLCECSLCQPHAQTFECFGMGLTNCLSELFALDELTWWRLSCTCPDSVVFSITQRFLNVRKPLRGHAKNSNFAIMFKSIKFYLLCKHVWNFIWKLWAVTEKSAKIPQGLLFAALCIFSPNRDLTIWSNPKNRVKYLTCARQLVGDRLKPPNVGEKLLSIKEELGQKIKTV